MRSTATTTIQKTKKFTKLIQLFHMMKKIQTMKRVKSEAYDAEINEIVPDDLGEEVELSEEDDEEEDS